MSGRRTFGASTKNFTPEGPQRITEMPLPELRRARALTQGGMAKMLKVSQPAVSKLEQRADIYVSSLRSYIEAAGGKLKIVAEFPEGEVAITNFSQAGETDAVWLEAEGGHLESPPIARERPTSTTS